MKQYLIEKNGNKYGYSYGIAGECNEVIVESEKLGNIINVVYQLTGGDSNKIFSRYISEINDVVEFKYGVITDRKPIKFEGLEVWTIKGIGIFEGHEYIIIVRI